jgi:general stress protein 26
MKVELEKLYEHIDNIEIAMMTTRRPDGHLQARAMATQKRADSTCTRRRSSKSTSRSPLCCTRS